MTLKGSTSRTLQKVPGSVVERFDIATYIDIVTYFDIATYFADQGVLHFNE